MTLEETTKLITEIVSYWPNFKFTPQVTNTFYCDLFSSYEVKYLEGRAAIRYLVDTGHENTPTAPTIIKAIKALRERGKNSTAEEHWATLMDLARRSAAYAYLKSRVGERACRALGGLSGWTRLRYANNAELGFMRRDFVEAYRNISEKENQEASAAFSAVGLVEEQARRIGQRQQMLIEVMK